MWTTSCFASEREQSLLYIISHDHERVSWKEKLKTIKTKVQQTTDASVLPAQYLLMLRSYLTIKSRFTFNVNAGSDVFRWKGGQ